MLPVRRTGGITVGLGRTDYTMTYEQNDRRPWTDGLHDDVWAELPSAMDGRTARQYMGSITVGHRLHNITMTQQTKFMNVIIFSDKFLHIFFWDNNYIF